MELNNPSRKLYNKVATLAFFLPNFSNMVPFSNPFSRKKIFQPTKFILAFFILFQIHLSKFILSKFILSKFILSKFILSNFIYLPVETFWPFWPFLAFLT